MDRKPQLNGTGKKEQSESKLSAFRPLWNDEDVRYKRRRCRQCPAARNMGTFRRKTSCIF